MRTSWRRKHCCRREAWPGPPTSGRVKDKDVIVVVWAFATANHDNLVVNEGRGVCSAGRRNVTQGTRIGPLHRLWNAELSLFWHGTTRSSPVWKHQTSLQHPFSSQPPYIHATPSTRVAVCARNPCVGRKPYTGALPQYISVAGAGSQSLALGIRGASRYRGLGGTPFSTAGASSESLSLSFASFEPFTSLLSRFSRIVALDGLLDRALLFGVEPCDPLALLLVIIPAILGAVMLILSLSRSRMLSWYQSLSRSPAGWACCWCCACTARRLLLLATRRFDGFRGPAGPFAADATLPRLLVLA